MSAPRFYCPADLGACLPEREAHHALHVLRLREGDEVELLDGCGRVSTARIVRAARHEVACDVLEMHQAPPPSVHITLLQGITKPRSMDWLLQKATELGVARIIPLATEHGVVRIAPGRRKEEKWHWIAVDALKQSGRTWLPEIGAPVELQEYLRETESFAASLLASIQATRSLREAVAPLADMRCGEPIRVAYWVGPEGDFSPAEQEAIRATGAEPVSLGSAVLRSETAALYGLAALRYALS